jgi:hypothetical protein
VTRCASFSAPTGTSPGARASARSTLLAQPAPHSSITSAKPTSPPPMASQARLRSRHQPPTCCGLKSALRPERASMERGLQPAALCCYNQLCIRPSPPPHRRLLSQWHRRSDPFTSPFHQPAADFSPQHCANTTSSAFAHHLRQTDVSSANGIADRIRSRLPSTNLLRTEVRAPTGTSLGARASARSTLLAQPAPHSPSTSATPTSPPPMASQARLRSRHQPPTRCGLKSALLSLADRWAI